MEAIHGSIILAPAAAVGTMAYSTNTTIERVFQNGGGGGVSFGFPFLLFLRNHG